MTLFCLFVEFDGLKIRMQSFFNIAESIWRRRLDSDLNATMVVSLVDTFLMLIVRLSVMTNTILNYEFYVFVDGCLRQV